MKFVTKQLLSKGGRLGHLSGLQSCPDAVHQTPMLILNTQVGSVPHITEDNLEILLQKSGEEEHRQLSSCSQQHHQQTARPVLSVSAQHFAMHLQILKKFKKGVAAFAALPGHCSTASVHCSSVTTPSGYNESNFVSVWTKAGKHKLRSQNYMELVSEMHCDWCEALYNSDTPPNASSKRMNKCTSHSLSYLTECLQLATKLPHVGGVLAPLLGGWDVAERTRYCDRLRKTVAEGEMEQTVAVSGYSLVGLHSNGPGAEDLKPSTPQLLDCVRASLVGVPNDLPRAAHGGYCPHTTLALVAEGVDVLDTALPSLATERGAALTFRYTKLSTKEEECCKNNGSAVSKSDSVTEPITKKLKANGAASDGTSANGADSDGTSANGAHSDGTSADSDGTSANGAASDIDKLGEGVENSKDMENSSVEDKHPERPYEINIKNIKYVNSLDVLVRDCLCYTCSSGFTRGYLHHLSQCNEMVLPLLLNMHNLHHWLGFFTSIRLAIAGNSLHHLTSTVLDSYVLRQTQPIKLCEE